MIRPYTVGSMSSGTTDTESGARGLRSVLASPWARRTWRDLGFTVLSAGLNLLPLLVMALPWTFFFYVPISLLAVLTCMFVSVAAAVALCPWLTVPRRACYYEVLGVRIPRPPALERSPDSSGGVWSALRDRARSPRTWRQACYHLVVGPAVNLLGLLGGVLWVAALIGLATSAVLALLTAVGVFRYAGQRVWDGAEICRAGPAGAAGSARGGEGGTDRAARAGARTAPGGARRPRPGRRADRDRRPLPGAGTAERGRAPPGLAYGGGGGVLHRLRGPGQREQARPGHGGAGGRATGRPDAADLGHRRRDRRRGRGPGHRPDRAGAAGRLGGRQLRDKQPARRTDDDSDSRWWRRCTTRPRC